MVDSSPFNSWQSSEDYLSNYKSDTVYIGTDTGEGKYITFDELFERTKCIVKNLSGEQI